MNLSPPENKVPIEILFFFLILIQNFNALTILLHYSSNQKKIW